MKRLLKHLLPAMLALCMMLSCLTLLVGAAVDDAGRPILSVKLYTPRGTAVDASVTVGELTAGEQSAATAVKKKYSALGADCLEEASLRYNCHSYAWYSNSTLNSYWMKDPSKYMSDGSYTRVQKINLASKVYYTSTNHSARVYDAEGSSINNAYVISKWGNGPVMVHKVYDCPYTYPDNNELLRTTVTLWK